VGGVTIIERLATRQPGVIVELIKRRLLSTVNVRRLLGMEEPPERAPAIDMGHDAYRRVRGRVRQTRWSA